MINTINDEQFIIQKFLENPDRMRMGSGKLSKRYKCERDDIISARQKVREILKKESKQKFPNILILDIETSPLLAYVWQTQVWNARVPHDFVATEWFMLTWAAKWLFDDTIMSDKLTKQEVLNEDDSRITKSIWKLLDEADIVITHNGKKFDIPNLNTRFLFNNMKPTSPYRQIDTKIVASREFGFTHNSLTAIGEVLGLGSKIDTDFELWKACIHGNDKALKDMETYNKQDVKLLEDVYLELLPWIRSHPNIGVFMESGISVCANCGDDNIKENGFYYTNVSKFQAYECNNCGAVSRSRMNSYDKNRRKSLLAPVARQ